MPDQKHHEEEQDITFERLFVPFTTKKAIVFIGLIGLFVFGNALFGGFVWDDFGYILLNQQVHSLSNLSTAFGPNLFNYEGQYRPVNFLYFSFLYAFFKESPFFYLVLGIALHTVNTILVFLCFKKVFARKLAFFLSLIFLVHPMQVESSTFIATSGDRLFFLFGTTAFLLSLTDSIKLKRALAIGVLLLLSLLSKETGILFFVMIFSYALAVRKNRKLLAGVFIITGACYSLLRFVVGGIYFHATTPLLPMAQLPLQQRLLNIPEIVLYYLQTFLFPAKLAIMQLWTIPEVNYQYFYIPLAIDVLFLVALGLFGVSLYKAHKRSWILFLFFTTVFISGLAMHLQILPLDMTVADRWFYLPMVGLLGAFGVVIEQYTNSSRRQIRNGLLYCGIGLILLLSLRTIVRNNDWQNALTLYTHDSNVRTNFELESNLGWVYQMSSDFPNALVHYKKSVDLYPVGANVSNLANIYVVVGDKQHARQYFYQLFEVKDNTVELYNQHIIYAGWTLLENDTPDVARDFLHKALEKNPTSGALWAYLAVCEYRLHHDQVALQDAAKAQTFSTNPAFAQLSTIIKKKSTLPPKISLFL
jgi:tetratricopeptide (TPR) repeat protein